MDLLRRRLILRSRIGAASRSRCVLLGCPNEQTKQPNLKLLTVKLLNDLFLDRHFLQDGQTKPLRDTSIRTVHIPGDNLEDFLQDNEVIWCLSLLLTSWDIDKKIVNTLYSASDDRDQRTNGMLQT